MKKLNCFLSHSRCASSTILGNLFSDFTPSPLTQIPENMSFGASGVNSSENLSSLLEEITAGMALPANNWFLDEP